ncbi:MAG: glycosyl transferase [Bacteroidales bacterium]|nr:glycosyl transferase [Bacteroidales bacterium]
MIPKVIHYCWFGRNPLPKMAVKCIESWKTFLPDYEIKEWNEDNFDVNIIPYTKDAYADGKYAFVSDYARFWILYHYGGVYFDTDVEVIKPMDDIIERGPFMGLEIPGEDCKIAPGLGLAVEAGNPIYETILEGFEKLDYHLPDGSRNPYTMIPMVTDIMKLKGLNGFDSAQNVNGIFVYAPDYFNPLDDATGRLRKTGNTRTIHWFMKSWLPEEKPFTIWVKRVVRRILGVERIAILQSSFKK